MNLIQLVGHAGQDPFRSGTSWNAGWWSSLVAGYGWFSDLGTSEQGRDSLGVERIDSRGRWILGFEAEGHLRIASTGTTAFFRSRLQGAGPRLEIRMNESSPFGSGHADYSPAMFAIGLASRLRESQRVPGN